VHPSLRGSSKFDSTHAARCKVREYFGALTCFVRLGANWLRVLCVRALRIAESPRRRVLMKPISALCGYSSIPMKTGPFESPKVYLKFLSQPVDPEAGELRTSERLFETHTAMFHVPKVGCLFSRFFRSGRLSSMIHP
jgi:hypothetical protein